MNITGKIIGFLMGFALFGPVGSMIGLFLGHQVDKHQGFRFQANPQAQRHMQQVFSDITFSVMGHIAKADGRVSENEIRVARAIMEHLGFNEEQRQRAMNQFSLGKDPAFNLHGALETLLNTLGHQRNILRMFMDIQIQAVYADKMASPFHQALLQDMCLTLRMPPLNFQILDMMYGHAAHHHHRSYQKSHDTSQGSLDEAYAILSINKETSKVDVKRAYRKLMSQHHPDKLVSKGLPEEMIKLATEKTQRIQKAYDQVCVAKGW